MARQIFPTRLDARHSTPSGSLIGASSASAKFFSALALLLLVATLISGCSHRPVETHKGQQQSRPQPASNDNIPTGTLGKSSKVRRAIVLDALGQIGRPYRYGGQSPDSGFDCSGLVQYIFKLNGVSLPRTSLKQFSIGKKIKLENAIGGDLLFYKFEGNRNPVNHVAIYLGDGQAVHAPSTGKHVIVAPIANRWWRDRFIAAVRVLK